MKSPSTKLIKVGGRTEQALPLADMNSVVARGIPITLARHPQPDHFGNHSQNDRAHNLLQKEYGDLGYFGGGLLYTGIMKETDSRTWRTLPSNFQVCRVNTPANRKLKLGRSDGGEAEIDLIDGSVNVVYVKQTTSGTIPKIFQFKVEMRFMKQLLLATILALIIGCEAPGGQPPSVVKSGQPTLAQGGLFWAIFGGRAYSTSQKTKQWIIATQCQFF